MFAVLYAVVGLVGSEHSHLAIRMDGDQARILAQDPLPLTRLR